MVPSCLWALSLVVALVLLGLSLFLGCTAGCGACVPVGRRERYTPFAYGRDDPRPRPLLVDLEMHMAGVYNPSLHVPSGDSASRLVLSVRSAPLHQADDSELLVGRGQLAFMKRADLKPLPQFFGCMDARLFVHRGQLLAVACEVRHPSEGEEEDEDPCTRMCLLNVDTGQKSRLTCASDSSSRSDKNWIPIRTGEDLFFVHTLSPFRLLRATLPAFAAWPSEVPCVDVPVDPDVASGASIARGWRGSSVAVPGPRGSLLALVHRRLDITPRSLCPRYEHAFATLEGTPPHAPLSVGPVFELRGRDDVAQDALSAPHRASHACRFHYLNSVILMGERVLFCVGVSDENAAVVSAPRIAVVPFLLHAQSAMSLRT